MSKKIILDIISFLLILLFGYAATAKLSDYRQFVLQISEVIKLNGFPNWIALLVPLTELLACVLLIVPKWNSRGLFLSFLILLSFTFYIGSLLALKENLPCRCGGILNSLGWKSHLLFNAIFTSIALFGVLISRSTIKFNSIH